MPFTIQQTGDQWQVINAETGDVKGTHANESEAKDQLAALYANQADEGKSVEKSMFIPITKIDTARQEVWGYGALEQPDATDEIMDYESSKPYFERWSQGAQKRSGGKSLGNVRAMHSNVAAGKLVAFNTDDARKGFYIGAKIVDTNEWKKVEQGVYTGFSVGGKYVKRWPDREHPGMIRYTAGPSEFSIVDAPCIPGATFDIVKGEQLTKGEFHPTDGVNTLLIEPEPELDKAVPGAPQPIASIHLDSQIGPNYAVERIPEPGVPLVITPGSEPSQETLQSHAIDSQSLEAALNAWLPKVGETVTKAIEDALKSASTDAAPRRWISIKPRLIKVKRS